MSQKIVIINADNAVCTMNAVNEAQGKQFKDKAEFLEFMGMSFQEDCVEITTLDDFVNRFNYDQIGQATSFIIYCEIESL